MQTPNLLEKTLVEWSEVFMRNSMRNFIQYSKESGLSMSQIGALFRIFHQSNSAITDIAGEMGITTAAASQMVDRLVHMGLILRSEDPSDRRMKQLVLTDKGRQVMQDVIVARQSWLSSLAGMLSESDQEQAEKTLRLLIDHARQLQPPAMGKALHPSSG